MSEQQLPENSNLALHEPEDDHAGDDHLAHLLPPASVNKNLLVSLFQSIKELINPPVLPPLEITSKPVEIEKKKGLYAGNEWKAAILSLGINGGLLLLLALAFTVTKVVQEVEKKSITLVEPIPIKPYKKPPPPKLPPKEDLAQGGGGHTGQRDVTKGKLPKAAPKQFVAPTLHTVTDPKLVTPAQIVLDADLPNINAANYGDPNAKMGLASLGNGIGTGIGSGKGPGVGPGEGGGTGGGIYRAGGGVSKPTILTQVEPEYSEEARKAKYQGQVQLSIVVDINGVPEDIQVTRKLGLGLDEKAIEAVRKWRFKPGTKDGKPVKVRATIEVSFHIL